jgi:CheY-like chemotaxis protein
MKSVLVVDDDAMVLSFTARAIGRLGLDVIRAASAFEAIKALGTHAQICLVVSDVQMPQMSGIELHSAMCEDLRWRSIPRILMTGGEPEGLPPDVLVVRKPFSVSQIRCLVVAHVGGTCPSQRTELEGKDSARAKLRVHAPVLSHGCPQFCVDPCESCRGRITENQQH